ncbi:hypothetical protein PHYPSEUDO_004414 [Phytophthora pseudosyringae]|uniref:Ubiquitin-like domain-containing protein n=1 Tax=Phytophthora pseudosyringae TaxID=221518 RepID=A0A8T1VRQ5_9STRA|nr:hypothetical protein PHYPSEUDO_004414 [Phytophthora pseudosyringae]
MADELTVKVVSGTSESLHVRVDLASASVLALKQLIEQQNARRFPVSAQRLIFQGQILQDDKLLADYHVAAGCALHLTLTPGAVAANNATADRAVAPTAGPSPPAQLRTSLQQMRDREPHEQYATAVRTLQKICANVVGHPSEDKYRKLRVDNAALKAKLFDRTRGQESVKLLGFQDGVQAGHLVLVPTPEKWENLVACKAVVDSVATALGGAAAAASPFGAAPSMGGMGGFGGLGGDFASQAQALMQNPAMLQSMANNPMVQQMAQQNPMLAQALQNPAMLAQSVQALQQNPAMMQQVNQMMSDPNAMARMQQMMAGGGMGGLGGPPFAPSSAAANPFAAGSSAANPFASMSTPAAPAPTPAPAASPAAASSSAAATSIDNSDEEDEIAKAIARSLQDQ